MDFLWKKKAWLGGDDSHGEEEDGWWWKERRMPVACVKT